MNGHVLVDEKKKTVLSIILFVLIFGGLLLTATFTDLRVSHLLTGGVLPKNKYLASDFFGVTFESVGSLPVYLLLAFCGLLLFWYMRRVHKKGALADVSQLVFLGTSVAAYFAFFKETLGYISQHLGVSSVKKEPYMIGTALFLAMLLTVFSALSLRSVQLETLTKLLKFVMVSILVVICSEILVNLLKTPMGRMRYRAMNSENGEKLGGFKNFTKWYVANGQIYTKAEQNAMFGASDAFKSFPSGHTCAAGMSYCAILLIDALGIRDKKKKALLWIAPIVYTGIVAVSRIMVGAHFFSDVLVGGTIPFVFMILFREIILCKNAHLKALFDKKS